MSKHTPGPWFIWAELAMQREGTERDEIDDELLFESEFQICAGSPIECTRSSMRGHSAHICDIYADNLDFDDGEEKSKATALANARLIAAAPELLEALRAIVKSLVDQDDEGMIEHAQQMIDARAAIAKAEAS